MKRRRKTGLPARRRKGDVRWQRHRDGFFYAILIVYNRQPLLDRKVSKPITSSGARCLCVSPLGVRRRFGLVCRRVGKLACFPAPHEARSAHAVIGTCSPVKRTHCFVKDAVFEKRLWVPTLLIVFFRSVGLSPW